MCLKNPRKCFRVILTPKCAFFRVLDVWCYTPASQNIQKLMIFLRLCIPQNSAEISTYKKIVCSKPCANDCNFSKFTTIVIEGDIGVGTGYIFVPFFKPVYQSHMAQFFKNKQTISKLWHVETSA